MSEPVERTREIRLDFLVKLFFAQRTQPDIVADLIAHQRETLTRNIASLGEQRAALAAKPDAEVDNGDRQFTLAVLDLRRSQTEAALDWLDQLSPIASG